MMLSMALTFQTCGVPALGGALWKKGTCAARGTRCGMHQRAQAYAEFPDEPRGAGAAAA